HPITLVALESPECMPARKPLPNSVTTTVPKLSRTWLISASATSSRLQPPCRDGHADWPAFAARCIAHFTSEGAMKLGFGFFDLDKVVFASDCPFDPEKGTMYIRETLRILDEYGMPDGDLRKVYYKNLERITDKTFVQ